MVTKEFIREYQPYLSSVYRKKDKGLTKEDIQDLVQDTFEKVTLYKDYFIHDYDKNHKIPEHKRLKSWLNLVTVQVYDRYKRGSLQIDEIVNDYSKDDLLTSSNEYYYNTNKEEVDTLINLLPNNQRDVVYLKLILGCTHYEVASKLNVQLTTSQTLFKRGLANLKQLVNSDNPECEVLYEPKILKPYGDKPYAGEWSWRYGESKERKNSQWYRFNNDEVIAYCNERNLKYNVKERKL